MSISPPNSFFTVPSGPLQISDLPPATSDCTRFSLAIPTYNEAKNVHNIVKLLRYLLDAEITRNYELIVVNDNSPGPHLGISDR